MLGLRPRGICVSLMVYMPYPTPPRGISNIRSESVKVCGAGISVFFLVVPGNPSIPAHEIGPRMANCDIFVHQWLIIK